MRQKHHFGNYLGRYIYIDLKLTLCDVTVTHLLIRNRAAALQSQPHWKLNWQRLSPSPPSSVPPWPRPACVPTIQHIHAHYHCLFITTWSIHHAHSHFTNPASPNSPSPIPPPISSNTILPLLKHPSQFLTNLTPVILPSHAPHSIAHPLFCTSHLAMSTRSTTDLACTSPASQPNCAVCTPRPTWTATTVPMCHSRYQTISVTLLLRRNFQAHVPKKHHLVESTHILKPLPHLCNSSTCIDLSVDLILHGQGRTKPGVANYEEENDRPPRCENTGHMKIGRAKSCWERGAPWTIVSVYLHFDRWQ